jgi:hypothetical protein
MLVVPSNRNGSIMIYRPADVSPAAVEIRRLETEVMRLQAELDKAHRLLGQMISWQYNAEIAKFLAEQAKKE